MIQVLTAVVRAELARLEVEGKRVRVHAADASQPGRGVAQDARKAIEGPLMWLPRTLRLLNSFAEWGTDRRSTLLRIAARIVPVEQSSTTSVHTVPWRSQMPNTMVLRPAPRPALPLIRTRRDSKNGSDPESVKQARAIPFGIALEGSVRHAVNRRPHPASGLREQHVARARGEEAAATRIK
ncbi:MAG: hypothetical protein ACK58T_03265 [Phycisphaerae bacterium]